DWILLGLRLRLRRLLRARFAQHREHGHGGHQIPERNRCHGRPNSPVKPPQARWFATLDAPMVSKVWTPARRLLKFRPIARPPSQPPPAGATAAPRPADSIARRR